MPSPTRQRLLDAAERLIAEHGPGAVSNRQIAEAAGQANNSAVAYHLGSRTDLVLAVLRGHGQAMDVHRERLLAATAGSDDVRDRIACLVLPVTRHLADIGVPSWFARFLAQVTTDPAMRDLVLAEITSSPAMRRAQARVLTLGQELPASVATLRAEMTRHVVVHTCAERERALAGKAITVTGSWEETGDAIIDAVTAMMTAPVGVASRG